MSTKSTEFLHIWHRMPVHKTHDFSAISYFRKVSQAATHDGGCHRATFSWAQNLVRMSPERVHSVFNHPWGDKPANNKETYGLSALGAGSDLSRTFIFNVLLACRLLMAWHQLICSCCTFLRYTCTYMYCVSKTLDMFESDKECWWLGIYPTSEQLQPLCLW